MKTIPFTVDSALLQELGERLVGKPYIALAELVKNSYDADATNVEINFDPNSDRIIITDNGHGMNFEEFTKFWMRIGSPHKGKKILSRKFKRKMTGSKGVGRLAVQLLAYELELVTVSEKDITKQLRSTVNWNEAIETGELTNATAYYEIINNEEKKQGTTIILTKLKQKWDSDSVQGLAKEIWWLQPPFRSLDISENELGKTFYIDFKSHERVFERLFNRQINAILNIWYAKIVGKNTYGNVTVTLEFKGENPINDKFKINDCKLKNGNFEIRIYYLYGRQEHGIKVSEAKDYFEDFGGVHVYDGGFHLPYYGSPKNDWLRVEYDHSHRLSISPFLPDKYRIKRGLQFLPTLSKIFGVVNVDTSSEEDLNILITRDRLQESDAYENLVYMVRWALDFYAYQEKLRSIDIKESRIKIRSPKYKKLEDVLEEYKDIIPANKYNKLKKDIQKASDEIKSEAEIVAERVGLIGSLATAGMSSLAVHHETKLQVKSLDDINLELSEIELDVDEKNRRKIRKLKNKISDLIERINTIRSLFAYFGDTENIQVRERFVARSVLKDIKNQVVVLAKNVTIDLEKVEYVKLPEASLIEWNAIFQNVFINAFNALVDSKNKKIQVSLLIKGENREILVQDTGVGVDLNKAEELFKPFVRKSKISPEREALGYGGMGLGLTIVRLVANRLGCKVSFVQPEEGFNTAFSLRWSERK